MSRRLQLTASIFLLGLCVLGFWLLQRNGGGEGKRDPAAAPSRPAARLYLPATTTTASTSLAPPSSTEGLTVPKGASGITTSSRLGQTRLDFLAGPVTVHLLRERERVGEQLDQLASVYQPHATKAVLGKRHGYLIIGEADGAVAYTWLTTANGQIIELQTVAPTSQAARARRLLLQLASQPLGG